MTLLADPGVAVAHRLTDAERAAFERDGFLLLRQVLDPERRSALLRAAERLDAEYRAEPGVTPHHVCNRHDLIEADDAFLDLVDLPTVFPKVFGILGWNIQLFHTQLVVTPPAPAGAPAGGYGWHQDNNRMNLDFETPPPHPRVSVKVGYFLTDLPRPGMGNLCVVPGSHRLGRPDVPLGEQPPGATEVTAAAGDAILFDRRIWHAASTNTSDTTRVFLTYGYSYRWLRPKSRMQHDALFARCDPVRRQLLGAAPTGANGYFDPADEDVPLRGWIRAHLGDGAVTP
ncbi:MAG: hypothetical protein KatS3mg009_2325 [Acidimicrobiia bacterium]|nr:MAG: hypothetical protein KatS3mg009_2325 [Acidimicrobiia bacterium]